MPTLFATTRRVEFADTDMAGIVHFAVYFNYLEEAEHAFFRSLGLSIMRHDADGTRVSWPRVAASCSFAAPAFYEDLLDLRLTDLQLGDRSLSFAWEVCRGETQLATGAIKTACCRFVPGQPPKSIDIPQDIRETLEAAGRAASGQ